jgi:hypothetical protein
MVSVTFDRRYPLLQGVDHDFHSSKSLSYRGRLPEDRFGYNFGWHTAPRGDDTFAAKGCESLLDRHVRGVKIIGQGADGRKSRTHRVDAMRDALADHACDPLELGAWLNLLFHVLSVKAESAGMSLLPGWLNIASLVGQSQL